MNYVTFLMFTPRSTQQYPSVQCYITYWSLINAHIYRIFRMRLYQNLVIHSFRKVYKTWPRLFVHVCVNRKVGHVRHNEVIERRRLDT